MFEDIFNDANLESEIGTAVGKAMFDKCKDIFCNKTIEGWFDFGVYVEATDNYDLNKWRWALVNRSVVLEMLDNPHLDYVSKVHSALMCIVQTQSLGEAKTGNIKRTAETSVVKEFRLSDLVDRLISISSGNKPDEGSCLKILAQFLDDSKNELLSYHDVSDDYLGKWIGEDVPVFSKHLTDLIPYEIYGQRKVDISFNLSAPKEKIIEDFSKLVDELKNKHIEPPITNKIVTDAMLEDWRLNMLLAYIDIFILMKLSKENLTHYRIGCMLFPDNLELNPAEKIRKTVKPKALQIVSPSFVSYLESQLIGID